MDFAGFASVGAGKEGPVLARNPRRTHWIDLIRRLAPDAAIHYNNPVRARHCRRR